MLSSFPMNFIQFPQLSSDSPGPPGSGARDPLGRAVGGHAPQHLRLRGAVVWQRSVRQGHLGVPKCSKDRDSSKMGRSLDLGTIIFSHQKFPSEIPMIFQENVGKMMGKWPKNRWFFVENHTKMGWWLGVGLWKPPRFPNDGIEATVISVISWDSSPEVAWHPCSWGREFFAAFHETFIGF